MATFNDLLRWKVRDRSYVICHYAIGWYDILFLFRRIQWNRQKSVVKRWFLYAKTIFFFADIYWIESNRCGNEEHNEKMIRMVWYLMNSIEMLKIQITVASRFDDKLLSYKHIVFIYEWKSIGISRIVYLYTTLALKDVELNWIEWNGVE